MENVSFFILLFFLRLDILLFFLILIMAGYHVFIVHQLKNIFLKVIPMMSLFWVLISS